MSALLTVMCMTLGLNVGALQEDPYPKLKDQMKALQAERRELTGDIAALEVEVAQEMTAEKARKLAIMRLQLEEVEDEIDDLRRRRHEMMQREKNAEAQRAYESARKKEEHKEGVDDVLHSLFQRLEGMEKAFQELQAHLEDQIASGRRHIDEATQKAHEALRLYEESLRRREGEAGERHGLTPPREHRKGGTRGIPPSRDDGMDPEVRAKLDQMRVEETHLEDLVRQLAREYREAESDDHKEACAGKIKDALGKQFELRAEMREFEIHDLERKLDALREEFERKMDQRDRLIRRRLEDLIGI